MQTADFPQQQGKHAAGPVSSTEWARGLFVVFTFASAAVLVVAAVLRAYTVVEWLGFVWLSTFVAVNTAVTAAEVRNRPADASAGAALLRSCGLRPLSAMAALSLVLLPALLVILAVQVI